MIRKTWDWLHQHPWIIVSFLAGTNLGVLLFHFVTDRDTAGAWATLTGSVIGSMVAVFGAVWVSQASMRRGLQELRYGVDAVLNPLRKQGAKSLAALVMAEGQQAPLAYDLDEKLGDLKRSAEDTLADLREIREAFAIRAVDRIIYNQLCAAVGNIKLACNNQIQINQLWHRYEEHRTRGSFLGDDHVPSPLTFERLAMQFRVLDTVFRLVGHGPGGV